MLTGMEIEGLFRRSPNAVLLKQMQEKCNQGKFCISVNYVTKVNICIRVSDVTKVNICTSVTYVTKL